MHPFHSGGRGSMLPFLLCGWLGTLPLQAVSQDVWTASTQIDLLFVHPTGCGLVAHPGKSIRVFQSGQEPFF